MSINKRECRRRSPLPGFGVSPKTIFLSPPQAASQKEWKVDRKRLREKSVWERVLGVPPALSEWVG